MFLGWLKRFLGGGYYDNKFADILFLSLIEVITDTAFLKKIKIEDGFDNRMACLAAFMFCWQDYLQKNKQTELRKDFMDLTVKLLDDSLRAEGVSDIRIGKKVKQKLQHFYAQLFAYDKLFGEHNNKPPKDEVQKIITHYLQSNDDGEAMATYLIDFHAKLNKTKPSELAKNNIMQKLIKV